MIVQNVRALRGPSVWSPEPALLATVDVSGWVDGGEARARVEGWLAGIRASQDYTPAAVEIEGAVGLFLRVVAELHALDVSFVFPGAVESNPAPGVYRLVIPYREEAFARACLDEAAALCNAATAGADYDPAATGKRFRDLAFAIDPVLANKQVVDAAKLRGIPVTLIREPFEDELLVLGQGVNQRRYLMGQTERDNLIAEVISSDKRRAKWLLAKAGIPVPEGRPVASAEEAWEAAKAFGPPVVVKPLDTDYGNGVSVELHSETQVFEAYAAAREKSDKIVVERQIPGFEHRVLVVGPRVVAAVLRQPPRVVGDGKRTILELVAEVNADPRRGDGLMTPLAKIDFDGPAMKTLTDQGYTPESVPPAGKPVLMRRNAHRWAGGTTVDVTDEIHPAVAARAVEAARVAGLQIAGIDIVAEDLTRPLEEQGGAVIEVNSGPALKMHLRPTTGRRRAIARAIVDHLFPPGQDGRIPVIAVSGDGANRPEVARKIKRLLRDSGRTVGLACEGTLYVGGRRIGTRDLGGDGAKFLLIHPLIDVAVIEAEPPQFIEHGLDFDRCAIHVNTDASDGRAVEAPVVRGLLTPDGVLVRPASIDQAGPSDRPVVLFGDRDDPAIRQARALGRRAVFADGERIVLAEGESEQVTPLMSLSKYGPTLAAVAAAWAFGLRPREIGVPRVNARP